MFNQVIFLSDGKIAFAGSTSGALDFFKELRLLSLTLLLIDKLFKI